MLAAGRRSVPPEITARHNTFATPQQLAPRAPPDRRRRGETAPAQL